MENLLSGDRSLGVDERTTYESQVALTRAILEACPDAILVVDERGMIVTHNQRFLDITGVRSDELPGANGNSAEGVLNERVLSPVVWRVKDPDAFLARLRELFANPKLDDHSEIEMTDGTTIERHSTGLWSKTGKYLGRVLFLRDITSRKQTEAMLKELAQTDSLTGVANRRQFFLQATEEFIRARRFGRQLAFIMMDIDRFKLINDRWGHAAGDDVLMTLCNAWKTVIRQVNLLARVGGEEFAVLLAETDLRGARVVAEKLRQIAAEQTVMKNNQGIRCTISAGVSTLTTADTTVEDCLRRADKALYQAKKNGRNRTEDGPEFGG